MLIFILCIESGSNFEFNINKDEQNVNNIIKVVSFKKKWKYYQWETDKH